MNNVRRKQLELAEQHIDVACDLIQTAMDDEQGCLDSLPESFAVSEMYERIGENIDGMSDALESLGDARDRLDEVIE